MPDIGRPSLGPNSFANIKIADKSQPNPEKIGDLLNQITGKREAGVKVLPVDAKHNQIGKDEFLKLLTFQLKNQDPLKPQDPNKFSGDLAQFAQLEQITNMRNEMKKLNLNGPNQLKYMAASFVGKKVTASGNSVALKGEGKPSNMYFSLKEPAAKVMVRVIDKSGATIREIEKKDMAAGLNAITWDGKSNDGTYAGNGEYRIWSVAWNKELERIPINSKTEGIVSDVTIEDGEAILTVSGKKVNLRDVSRFQMSDVNELPKGVN
jgi:flagellar basal-body rod modification protein FlgD